MIEDNNLLQDLQVIVEKRRSCRSQKITTKRFRSVGTVRTKTSRTIGFQV
jgi:hypothetical protein